MLFLPLEDHLNTFRERTKVRGNTFQERLDQFLARLEKVASDCESSSDKSQYRNDFGKTHTQELKNIRSLIVQHSNEDELKEIITSYVDYLNSHFKSMFEYAKKQNHWDWSIVGKADAICYILVELELVIK